MKKKNRRRSKVDRTERVLPPPEAQQHFRMWPMQALLVLGHPDGIDADEFEAALQIVETFKALVVEIGWAAVTIDRLMLEIPSATANRGMSDRDAERIVCWFEWSARLPLGLPPRLVEWIEDEVAIGSVEVLRRACRLWDRIRSERAKPPVAGIDRTPRHMLTIRPDVELRAQIDARPINRPAGTFFIPAGAAAHHMPSTPAGAQMRQASPRAVAEPSHAISTAHSSAGRQRR